MDGISVHTYEIKLNGKLKATAETYATGLRYYQEILNKMIIKHSSRLCEEVDCVEFINIETNAILEQASFN